MNAESVRLAFEDLVEYFEVDYAQFVVSDAREFSCRICSEILARQDITGEAPLLREVLYLGGIVEIYKLLLEQDCKHELKRKDCGIRCPETPYGDFDLGEVEFD